MASRALLRRKRLISDYLCASGRSVHCLSYLGHGEVPRCKVSDGNGNDREPLYKCTSSRVPRGIAVAGKVEPFGFQSFAPFREERGILTYGPGNGSVALEIELYNSMVDKEGTHNEKDAMRAYIAAREDNSISSEVVEHEVSSALINKVDAMLQNLEKEIDNVDAEIGDRWRILDRDYDGKVTPGEVASAALYLKSTLGKEGVQELISNLSKDGGKPFFPMARWRIGRASMTGLFNKVSVSPPISSNAATLRCFYSVDAHTQSLREKFMDQMSFLDINSQIGSCMPLAMMRIGTIIHNIEMRPGQGGKLVRAAGTCAKILKEPSASRFVSVRMPSGIEKLIDTRCKATIGQVSNPSHKSRKLRKAGQSRWLGKRPVVRGVAMNPVDHPHGGGEGRSKSSGKYGRTSVSPWGKPTKSGYKTGPLKRRK